MQPIRTRINGKTYTIDPGAFHALCDNPHDSEPAIMLADGLQNTRSSLTYMVHELLHASDWNASEEKVTKTAEDIGRVLWRLGFRLTSK